MGRPLDRPAGRTPYGEGDALVSPPDRRARAVSRPGARRLGAAVPFRSGTRATSCRRDGSRAPAISSAGFSGELIDAPMTRLLDDSAILLATVPAACATAAGALAERVVVPPTRTSALLLLLARLVNGEAPLAAFVRWELALLRDLGFGLDLDRCARVTGASRGAGTFVSPRTGRAVSDAGAWHLGGDRLLASAALPPLTARTGTATARRPACRTPPDRSFSVPRRVRPAAPGGAERPGRACWTCWRQDCRSPMIRMLQSY